MRPRGNIDASTGTLNGGGRGPPSVARVVTGSAFELVRWVASGTCELEHPSVEAIGLGFDVKVLERGREWHRGDVGASDPNDRAVEVEHRLFRDRGGDLGARS